MLIKVPLLGVISFLAGPESTRFRLNSLTADLAVNNPAALNDNFASRDLHAPTLLILLT
jgi:hypothetical protein